MWLRVLAIPDALSSPRVCSSYDRDIPGAMNETITTNMRHCLCVTLEEMMSQALAARRHLLMRLFNHQVIEYARWVAGRERLSADVYRGFFVSINPRGYLLLLALSYLPVWPLKIVREGM